MTRDETLLAACHARNQLFAEAGLMVIGLMAETAPELLRTALEKVFDLTAVQDRHDRAVLILSDLQGKIDAAQSRLEYLLAETEKVDSRLDWQNHALDLLGKRI